MYRSNALANYVLVGVVLPLALLPCCPLPWAVAQGQYNFIVAPAFSASGNLFVADFNGDGKPDLLDSFGNLLLGNGDGTFAAGPSVAGTPLAVADFNGDGKPDVLEQGTGTLLVLLGNGDGTFQAAISTNSGADLTGIAAGDLNGDGKADVVGVFNGNLLVYLSNGDGTFAAGVPYSLGTTTTPESPITLADFNGDKKTDLLVSLEAHNNSGPGQEIVLLGNGDGTFQTPITSPGVNGPFSVVTGDFNGAGKLDLAISFFGNPPAVSPGVSLLLGNGDGTFQTPTVVIPNTYGNLAVADLNGDDKLDLVLQSSPWAEIYLGNGNGTFSNTHSYFLNDNFDETANPVVADFNLDGKPDIANGTATLAVAHTYALQQQTTGIATADLNGDGNLDLLAVGAGGYSVLLGNGDGSFQPPIFYGFANGGSQFGMVLTDFNGDGKLDLAIPAGSQTVAVLLGKGDGTFGPPAYFFDGSGITLVSADFRSDGKNDLVASGPSGTAILLGNGDGTFQTASFISTNPGGGALFAEDLNGDGKPDLLIGNQAFLGNGDGTFTAKYAGNLVASTLTDINGDGKPGRVWAAARG